MNLNFKDKIKRSKILVSENKKKCLKSIKQNINLWCSSWSRHKLASTFYQKIKNRCIITKRGQSIKRDFKLSRLELKRWVNHKRLFYVKTSSW
jgi:ribosomal protein S14